MIYNYNMHLWYIQGGPNKNGTQTNVNNPCITKTSKVKFAHDKFESVQFMYFKVF